MPNDSIKKPVRDRKYLNKTFDSLREDLLEYARSYYPDRIQDFSDSSLGGLFLDFAAYVGDVTSFYLDHQFSELDHTTAVETTNIENHIINSGVEIVGAAPAVVPVEFTIEVPAIKEGNSDKPRSDLLPIIKAGTVAVADNGVLFNLLEDIDFSKIDKAGRYVARQNVGRSNSAGVPVTFLMTLSGLCVSGFYEEEQFGIGNEFVPFRRITLSNSNITQIVGVFDSNGNVYHEVKDLSEDVVFKGVTNRGADGELVQENLSVIPAPYRFKKHVDLSTRLTTLIFGGGTAESLDDDVIPDPSEFALPLYGKNTFPITSLDPGKLLQTKTLGVISSNTTLTVIYRWGGGLDHNVDPGSIIDIQTLLMEFPKAPLASETAPIRSSTTVFNSVKASGGEDPPTIDDLKALIPQARNAQERIVTREDLLARVYTMPSNFGRVFRAAIRSNPNNPLASQLFVISRDENSNLILSPDTLKDNLKTYLNQFRMISDAIDILDARIINLKIDFELTVDPAYNKQVILQNVLKELKKYFDIKNFNIDQPIVISDLINTIYRTPGIISVNNRQNNSLIKFTNLTGNVNGKIYSDVNFDVNSNMVKGMLIPPPGGIFEIRFPDTNIVGTII
jgi:hypothetical protein